MIILCLKLIGFIVLLNFLIDLGMNFLVKLLFDILFISNIDLF